MESFDWNFYLENNKDLVENGITNQEDAFNHWENFGMAENRAHKFLTNYILEKYFKIFLEYQEKNELKKEDAWDLLTELYNKNNNPEKSTKEIDKEMDIENFDWKFYIEKNNDLRQSGILTKELAIKHWVECGKFEDRKFKSIINKTNNINIKTVTFENFDWKFYIINNLDLIDNNYITKDKAWSHWINYGKYENRKVNTIIVKQEHILNDDKKIDIDYLIKEDKIKYLDNMNDASPIEISKNINDNTSSIERIKNMNDNISIIERIKNINNNLSNNKKRNISNNDNKKIPTNILNKKNDKSKNIQKIIDSSDNESYNSLDEKINNDELNDDKLNDELLNDDKLNDDKLNDDKLNNDKLNDELLNNDIILKENNDISKKYKKNKKNRKYKL